MLSEIVYKYALSILQGMGADIRECKVTSTAKGIHVAIYYIYEQREYRLWVACHGDDVYLHGVEIVNGLCRKVIEVVNYLTIDPELFSKMRTCINSIV